jgi:hypothetical protein
MFVVREHHAMTDEDFILDDDAFANETVGRDLAAGPDDSASLDLYECADPRLVAHCAAVEIHQVRMKDADVLSELDISADGHEWPFGRMLTLVAVNRP